MRQLQVDLGERSYPIYIGSGLLRELGAYLESCRIEKKSPLLIVTDEKVAPHYLPLVADQLRQKGYRIVSSVVPSGEQAKSLEVFAQVITDALDGGLDRNSTVLALGGGVVGDLAGYAAASYMRGVRFVQLPTTVLAHDSSVGGKVAINHPMAKNIIGAFHQPELVLYDIDTLRTLPLREIRAGLAEVAKHGLIWSREFADWCEQKADRLLKLESEPIMHALYEGCRIKSIVVSRDERENDLRAILNFGHTIGHALEAVAGYGELLHGEAISIGMVGAAKLSVRLGRPEHLYIRTKKLLQAFGLPVKLPAHLDVEQIMRAMMHDKKFKEGNMTFVLLAEIGQAEMQSGISAELVKETVEQLKEED